LEGSRISEVFSSLDDSMRFAATAHEIISAWTSWQHSWELAEFLQSERIMAHPTSHPASLVSEQHLWERGAITTVDHAVQGTVVTVAPFWLSRSGERRRTSVTAAPLFGQPTREVLKDWLGLGDDEIDNLDAAQVLT
jgi:benzylsuccinate CoA-transferase BbsF subunit/naphthyl-2-methylsuccinate CoA transferase subunit